jgi:ribose transport system substrate-binding protein
MRQRRQQKAGNHMQRRTTTLFGSVALLASASLIFAGCTGGDTGGDGGDGGTVELTYKAADGTCASAPADGVDYEAANALIESFSQPATGLLQTEPLPEAVTADTTVAFLNNGTAVAGLMYGFMEQATAAAGVTLINVDTGTDAQSINAAVNSVVELDPDVLISVAIDATFFQDQLAQLQENGVAVVYASQPNAAEFNTNDTLGGLAVSKVNGDVLAAGAIAATCGTGQDFVFYSIPELGFAAIQAEAAEAYLAEKCPSCTMRVVDISIVDPSPADKIVSDLQSHPETDYFVAAADQFQIGLADKASLAGITNAQGMGQSSLPPNIEQIVAGSQNAGFAVDLNMFMWLLLDEGFRKAQDVWVDYEDWEAVGQAVSRILTQQNAEEYVGGFVAYPDMQADFTALWGK